VTGLTNGVSYTFTVTATNAIGTSPPSAPSNAVIPKADLPSAPTNVVATAGNASATVTWTPPASNGGSPLTGYVITTDPPGGTTPPIGPGATSAVVSSLNNGTTYTIMVAATNSSGTGPAGTSNPVTPSGGPPPPNRTFLSTNFDSGIPNGWTNTFSSSAIKWHVTSACAAAHSGLAAYYGIDSTCTYNDGTSNIGTLQTPLLTGVPQNATLTVWSKRLVESCTGCTRDRTQIRVNYGSGFSDVYYRDASNPSNGVYEQLVIPLHSTTGQVQIRFVFNTTSTLNNNFFGWAIDDVVVQSP
jgi:hypothetical protein